ncbi:MAG: hypothetical protein HY067_09575 [Betaproteobacteria bacterium]|nr:hypothetical protein [Betaproteobacteria bacterium]
MATKNRIKSGLREVEIASMKLDQGLRALNALAKQHENGVDGETLSICVEQMTDSMLETVLTLSKIANRELHHG